MPLINGEEINHDQVDIDYPVAAAPRATLNFLSSSI